MLDLEHFIPLYSIHLKARKTTLWETSNLSNDEKIILIPLALNFPANRLRLTKSCCFRVTKTEKRRRSQKYPDELFFLPTSAFMKCMLLFYILVFLSWLTVSHWCEFIIFCSHTIGMTRVERKFLMINSEMCWLRIELRCDRADGKKKPTKKESKQIEILCIENAMESFL